MAVRGMNKINIIYRNKIYLVKYILLKIKSYFHGRKGFVPSNTTFLLRHPTLRNIPNVKKRLCNDICNVKRTLNSPSTARLAIRLSRQSPKPQTFL
jgi:hypothetical protein